MDRRVEMEKKERYAQALREQLESGQCTPASVAPDAAGSWGTADKVSQVQELMSQRIKSLHEEQQRMWQRVQAALAEQQGNAEAVAEKAASRCIEATLANALERAMAGVRQDCEALVDRRTSGVAEEVSGLRQAVDSLKASSDNVAAKLADHEARIVRLEQAQEEWARERAEIRREQQATASAVEELRTQLADVARQAAEVERVSAELQRVAAAQRDCASQLADLQREHRAVSEELAQLRSAQSEMAQQVAEIPRLLQKLQRLEEEMPRLAAKAAREALENARPPDPAPAPAPAPDPPAPPPMKVSAAAYAVFKNEDESYELHGLQNVVGRAATCDACISGSQAISNRHAAVDFDSEGRTSLRDLGSRNGTFLNDRRVPQDDRGFVLQSGDAVKLGIDGPVYIFEYGPAAFARWPQDLRRASGRREAAPGEADRPPRAPSIDRGGHRSGDGGGERRRGSPIDRSPAPAARGPR